MGFMNILAMDVSRTGLIHSHNPQWSKLQKFIGFIDKYGGKTTYRSPFYVNFDKFRPYKYFIVLFAEKGTGGKITAWGLCDREQCKKVKNKGDYYHFKDAPFGFEGHEDDEFKSLFYYNKIEFFDKPHQYKEFTLVSNGKKIKSLTALQNALHIEIPTNIFNEIIEKLK